MRVAIPVSKGVLSQHFGDSPEFALVDVDRDNGVILKQTKVPAPPHQPGLLPKWLAEKGVNLVMTCGIGNKAMKVFENKGIGVVVGCSPEEPETIVKEYLARELTTKENPCDH